MRSRFAAKAEEIVYGDREQAYDDPNRNFRNIAQVWSGILGVTISSAQVGLMMVGAKLVRENHKHQDDNIVDAYGYLMCVERIIEENEAERIARVSAERIAQMQEQSASTQKIREASESLSSGSSESLSNTLAQKLAEYKADLEWKILQMEKDEKNSSPSSTLAWGRPGKHPSEYATGSNPETSTFALTDRKPYDYEEGSQPIQVRRRPPVESEEST